MVLKTPVPSGSLEDPRLLPLFCLDALTRHFQVVIIRIKISIRKDVAAPTLAPTIVLPLIRVECLGSVVPFVGGVEASDDEMATICLERLPSNRA